MLQDHRRLRNGLISIVRHLNPMAPAPNVRCQHHRLGSEAHVHRGGFYVLAGLRDALAVDELRFHFGIDVIVCHGAYGLAAVRRQPGIGDGDLGDGAVSQHGYTAAQIDILHRPQHQRPVSVDLRGRGGLSLLPELLGIAGVGGKEYVKRRTVQHLRSDLAGGTDDVLHGNTGLLREGRRQILESELDVGRDGHRHRAGREDLRRCQNQEGHEK